MRAPIKKLASKQLVTAMLLVAVTSCSSQNTLDTKAPEPVVTTVVVPATNLSINSEIILASHNSVRNRLGVPPLRWSKKLEAEAAGWVNFLTAEGNCIPRNRGLVVLPGFKNGLGENLQRVEPELFGDGRTEVAPVDENNVVLAWAQQGIDYNYTDNQCRAGKNCDNYTQIVWRDSQVVGCAAASCPDSSQLWVCNYDPPGNFFEQKPY